MDKHTKRKIALRYWLLGAGYYKAAEAFDFAEQHRGDTLRKDGKTPAFAHEVGITSYVRTLIPHLREPEPTLCVALLHDMREDFDVSDGEVRSNWGNFVADGVDYMTKEFLGVRRDDVELFKLMATHPASSVDKGSDRINNQGSMLGVFSDAKCREYIEETRTLFFPMLKTARRRFPQQEGAYENIQQVLYGQIDMVEAFLATPAA